MPTPAVSIIMPAFNRERYLAESIESVPKQTFSDWELIVVDDGSSDSMPTLIERYRLRFPERAKPICQAIRASPPRATLGRVHRQRRPLAFAEGSERVDDLSAERKDGGTSLEAEAKAEKHHQEKNGL